MEKFERFKLETLETPESERGRMVRTLNAHSEAIEALQVDVARLTPTWEQLRTPVFTFAGVKCEAPARMTADEAADIILAEQAKLTRALNDPKLRVWTRAVTALMVGALRDHGREDR